MTLLCVGWSRILDFAAAHNLAVTNTFFKKRPSHLATYTSGGHATQIDYWMVRRRDLKQVTDTKVIPYESVAPQHRLLVMDTKIVKPKLPRCRTGPKRFKWWKAKEHKEKLTTMLLSLAVNTDQPAEKMWTEAAERIHNIAEDTVGSTKPGRKYIEKQVWWWNEEVQKAIKAEKLGL